MSSAGYIISMLTLAHIRLQYKSRSLTAYPRCVRVTSSLKSTKYISIIYSSLNVSSCNYHNSTTSTSGWSHQASPWTGKSRHGYGRALAGIKGSDGSIHSQWHNASYMAINCMIIVFMSIEWGHDAGSWLSNFGIDHVMSGTLRYPSFTTARVQQPTLWLSRIWRIQETISEWY